MHDKDPDPHIIPGEEAEQAPLDLFSAYELPSIKALLCYFRPVAGFPVQDTWLKAIKVGNYEPWIGLTYQNVTNYFPLSIETFKGHMVQI